MNEKLAQYLFNYNEYEGLWRAVHRDNYLELFNDLDSKNVVKSKNIKDLINYINKL